MRRAAPALPISPKLLKHFAAATLAITAIIAILADGSTTEAVAEQVKANELKKTEVDMLGAHKVAKSNLKVRADLSSAPVEGGESDLGGGGAAGSVATGSDDMPMMVLPPAAGPGQPKAPLAGQRPGPRKAKPQPAWPSTVPRPTAEQRAQLIEISRQRSGSEAASPF
jgi:hypothetical protein